MTTRAQEGITDTYNLLVSDKPLKVAALRENGTFSELYIQVLSEESLNAHIVIFAENVPRFWESMKLLRDKYVEWSKVAMENGVKDYIKVIDVEFPQVDIVWENSDIHACLNVEMKFSFAVSKDGVPAVVWNGRVECAHNDNNHETPSLLLASLSDFDSLISKINPNTIKEKLQSKYGRKEKIDALFK